MCPHLHCSSLEPRLIFRSVGKKFIMAWRTQLKAGCFFGMEFSLLAAG
jgi:hypothetical protein